MAGLVLASEGHGDTALALGSAVQNHVTVVLEVTFDRERDERVPRLTDERAADVHAADDVRRKKHRTSTVGAEDDGLDGAAPEACDTVSDCGGSAAGGCFVISIPPGRPRSRATADEGGPSAPGPRRGPPAEASWALGRESRAHRVPRPQRAFRTRGREGTPNHRKRATRRPTRGKAHRTTPRSTTSQSKNVKAAGTT